MARKTYSREDVETHRENFGEARPAVNVKVYRSIYDQDVWTEFDGYRTADGFTDLRFTREWIEENVTEETLNAIFWDTCENEFEQVQEDAREIFGAGVNVYREGRSGGWAVVDGLDELETWDAIMLGKWRKFERYAKQIAAGVPIQALGSIYANEFEAWADAQADASSANSEIPVDMHVTA